MTSLAAVLNPKVSLLLLLLIVGFARAEPAAPAASYQDVPCTPEQASTVVGFIAPISPGTTNIPPMIYNNCTYDQFQLKANPVFQCELPFATNCVYHFSYEKPVCTSLSCEFLPENLSSTNQTLAHTATRSEIFAYGEKNTCNFDVLRKSPYFAGNADFSVNLKHPNVVVITALPKSLQEKLALKKRDGTPVYTVDRSIKDVTLLTSTIHVGIVFPEGPMLQDGIARRYYTITRTETYVLGVESVEHPPQYKVSDTTTETDEKKNLVGSMSIQAPNNFYLDECVMAQSEIGVLDLTVKPDPQQPLYKANFNSLEPSVSGYNGVANFGCKETICSDQGCKESPKPAEFGIKVDQRVPSSFNFTTAISDGQFDLYQGEDGSDFSKLVTSYTNAHTRSSIGFNPKRETEDYQVTVQKASLCPNSDPCYTIVENDQVVSNNFTDMVAMKFFGPQQMQEKGFKVNSFGFSFAYEPYRKFATSWRFVVSFVMQPVTQRVQVRRSLVEENDQSNDNDPQRGFFNFLINSINSPTSSNPTNWLAVALGITTTGLVLAVGAVIALVALVIVVLMKYRNYQRV